jgi:hypothetical protein
VGKPGEAFHYMSIEKEGRRAQGTRQLSICGRPITLTLPDVHQNDVILCVAQLKTASSNPDKIAKSRLDKNPKNSTFWETGIIRGPGQ